MISSCAIHWEGLVGWGCVLLQLDPMGVLLVPVRGGGGRWSSGEVGLRGGSWLKVDHIHGSDVG